MTRKIVCRLCIRFLSYPKASRRKRKLIMLPKWVSRRLRFVSFSSYSSSQNRVTSPQQVFAYPRRLRLHLLVLLRANDQVSRLSFRHPWQTNTLSMESGCELGISLASIYREAASIHNFRYCTVELGGFLNSGPQSRPD
jgi:hypothetical protein